MLTNRQKELRRHYARKRKELEAILHPIPKFGDIEILHEHKRGVIEFTAWRGNDRVNWASLEVDKGTILTTKDFYKAYACELKRLTYEEG